MAHHQATFLPTCIQGLGMPASYRYPDTKVSSSGHNIISTFKVTPAVDDISEFIPHCKNSMLTLCSAYTSPAM